MRKKITAVLMTQVLAVLRNAPKLEPCRKFRRANVAEFMQHLANDRCEICLAYFREMDRISEMICVLERSNN